MSKTEKQYRELLLAEPNKMRIDAESGLLLALLDDDKTLLIMWIGFERMTAKEASNAYMHAVRLPSE